MPKSDTKTKSTSTSRKARKTTLKTQPKSTQKSKTTRTPRVKNHLSAIGSYDRNQLTKELLVDAMGLDIPPAAAELFIQKTLDAVETKLKPKKIITEHDLTLAISHELKKYNPNFAYIYQNRDKIV